MDCSKMDDNEFKLFLEGIKSKFAHDSYGAVIAVKEIEWHRIKEILLSFGFLYHDRIQRYSKSDDGVLLVEVIIEY